MWIAWALLVSIMWVCSLSQEYACPNHSCKLRLVRAGCWPPPAHLHQRHHFHWQYLLACALPAASDKVSSFNHSRKAASPRGLPHPGRTSTCWAGVGVGNRSSLRPEHLRFPLFLLKVQQFFKHKCFSDCRMLLVSFQSTKWLFMLILPSFVGFRGSGLASLLTWP